MAEITPVTAADLMLYLGKSQEIVYHSRTCYSLNA